MVKPGLVRDILLERRFSRILPSEFAVRAAPPVWREDLLVPAEEKIVARCGYPRRAQFATGRIIAREALEEIGFGHAAILPRKDRSPAWPENVIGSISHCAHSVVVCVAPIRPLVGVGIDIENIVHFSGAMQELFCVPSERSLIVRAEAAGMPELPTLLFSLKEAIFKAVSALSDRPVSLRDIRLTIALGTGQAILLPCDLRWSLDTKGLALEIGFSTDATSVATVAWVCQREKQRGRWKARETGLAWEAAA